MRLVALIIVIQLQRFMIKEKNRFTISFLVCTFKMKLTLIYKIVIDNMNGDMTLSMKGDLVSREAISFGS